MTEFHVSRFLSEGTTHTHRVYKRACAAASRFQALAYEMLGDSADRDTREGHRVMEAAEGMAESVVRGGMMSGTVHSRGRKIVISRVEASPVPPAPDAGPVVAEIHRANVEAANAGQGAASADEAIQAIESGFAVEPARAAAENDVIPTMDGFVVRDALGLVHGTDGRVMRALRLYQDAAKARFLRIPDADADADYAGAVEFAEAEGIRHPVVAIRAYTRTRCGELLAKARAIRAAMRCGNWQGDNGPLDLAAVQESLLQLREDRRAMVDAARRAAASGLANLDHGWHAGLGWITFVIAGGWMWSVECQRTGREVATGTAATKARAASDAQAWCEGALAPAPVAMVAQPVQQAQAKAGAGRYVVNREKGCGRGIWDLQIARETGGGYISLMTGRIGESVATKAEHAAMVRGLNASAEMLAALRLASVVCEDAVFDAKQSGERDNEAAAQAAWDAVRAAIKQADPAPAMVPQPCQQQQGRDMREPATADAIPLQVAALVARGALFVVNHSAGKDSQAMLIHLRQHIPAAQLLLIHADLGEVEWPGNVEHIEATGAGLPLIIARARRGLLQMIQERGMFPSPSNRQCTSDLKRGPIEREIRRYLAAHPEFGGLIVNCMGMRAQESPSRSKLQTFKPNAGNSKAGREWYDWLPIHALTTDLVFAMIRDAGQEPHAIYAAGMSRLSCCFCIMANRADLTTAARLNPDLYAKYCALERTTGHTMSMERRTLPEITGINPDAPRMVPQPVQQQQAQAGRREAPGVILGGAPEILQDNGPADVAEILQAMEAYFGPHSVVRARGPLAPVPFVIDHVEPRISLGGLSVIYLAALGGITAGALAFALLN